MAPVLVHLRGERGRLTRAAVGAARVLALTYGFFVLAAGARSGVQIATRLSGVLVVGLASELAPAAFPDATVWSGFGAGYGAGKSTLL